MSELVFTGGRVRFAGISSRAYEHPADRAALVALRKLHGLDTAVRKFQSLFSERTLRMRYLGTSVRTSERQFRRLHDMLRDAADVLDMPRVPELYIKQSPLVNASTVGMNEPFIVLNTALIDLMGPEELRCVLGHELGHAMSGHVLYNTIAWYLLTLGAIAGAVPLGGIGLQVILAALGEWSRKSELSSDRAGLLVAQDPEVSRRVLMKLAGGSYLDEMDVEEFLAQAAEYAKVGDVRDAVARVMLAYETDHPLAVVRVAEIDAWARGPQYAAALAGSYARREDDRTTSLTQEVREVTGDYGHKAAAATIPVLAKGAALGRRMVGRGRGDELPIKAGASDRAAPVEPPVPAHPAAQFDPAMPNHPAAPFYPAPFQPAAPVQSQAAAPFNPAVAAEFDPVGVNRVAPAWLSSPPADLPPDTPSWPPAPPVA